MHAAVGGNIFGVVMRFGGVQSGWNGIEVGQGAAEAVAHHADARQHGSKALFQHGGVVGGQVGFADEQDIGGGNLLRPDAVVAVGHFVAVDRIDYGDGAGDGKLVGEHGVGLNGSDDRCWLGQAGGFDHDSLKWRNVLLCASVQQAG